VAKLTWPQAVEVDPLAGDGGEIRENSWTAELVTFRAIVGDIAQGWEEIGENRGKDTINRYIFTAIALRCISRTVTFHLRGEKLSLLIGTCHRY
jgi:hypothetical protein